MEYLLGQLLLLRTTMESGSAHTEQGDMVKEGGMKGLKKIPWEQGLDLSQCCTRGKAK